MTPQSPSPVHGPICDWRTVSTRAALGGWIITGWPQQGEETEHDTVHVGVQIKISQQVMSLRRQKLLNKTFWLDQHLKLKSAERIGLLRGVIEVYGIGCH